MIVSVCVCFEVAASAVNKVTFCVIFCLQLIFSDLIFTMSSGEEKSFEGRKQWLP